MVKEDLSKTCLSINGISNPRVQGMQAVGMWSIVITSFTWKFSGGALVVSLVEESISQKNLP